MVTQGDKYLWKEMNDCYFWASKVIDSVLLLFVFSSENPEGLDVYMHILQLLTTVDDGIQAIGKMAPWDVLWSLI